MSLQKRRLPIFPSMVLMLGSLAQLCLLGSASAQVADEGWVFISNLEGLGSDATGDGTRAKPFQTAERALQAGPKVRFLPNAPNTPYPAFTLGGDTTTEYVLMADAGPRATRLVQFVSPGNRHFTLIGFFISNPTGPGIDLLALGNDALIKNCIVAYCGGIGVQGSYAVMLNCTVYANAATGVSLGRLFVKNCIISRNGGFGVSGTSGSPRVAHYSYIKDNVSTDTINATVQNPLTSGLAFVNAEECDFRLARPDPLTPGLFHQADPGIKSPDGTRSDPGAFGGPDCAAWFVRAPGVRPVIGSIVTDKSDGGAGTLKVKVRVRLAQ